MNRVRVMNKVRVTNIVRCQNSQTFAKNEGLKWKKGIISRK